MKNEKKDSYGLKRVTACYTVRCSETGQYYTGSTIDLQARWKQHRKGRTKAWELLERPTATLTWVECSIDVARALERATFMEGGRELSISRWAPDGRQRKGLMSLEERRLARNEDARRYQMRWRAKYPEKKAEANRKYREGLKGKAAALFAAVVMLTSCGRDVTPRHDQYIEYPYGEVFVLRWSWDDWAEPSTPSNEHFTPVILAEDGTFTYFTPDYQARTGEWTGSQFHDLSLTMENPWGVGTRTARLRNYFDTNNSQKLLDYGDQWSDYWGRIHLVLPHSGLYDEWISNL